MNAQIAYKLAVKPACVLADGPEEGPDGEAEYTVCFGDENGEPIDCKSATWSLWEHEAVCKFVNELCAKYGLENVNETMPV